VERMYNVVAINEKTGDVIQLNATPMTHKEACTFKSKFIDYPGRRIQLEEA